MEYRRRGRTDINVSAAATLEQIEADIAAAEVMLAPPVLEIEAVHQDSPNPCP